MTLRNIFERKFRVCVTSQEYTKTVLVSPSCKKIVGLYYNADEHIIQLHYTDSVCFLYIDVFFIFFVIFWLATTPIKGQSLTSRVSMYCA